MIKRGCHEALYSFRFPNAVEIGVRDAPGSETPWRLASATLREAKRRGDWRPRRSTFIHFYQFFIVLAWLHDNTFIGSCGLSSPAVPAPPPEGDNRTPAPKA
ncbi:MAG: hypothetical protein LBT49_07070 [Prevotellaceae bacterium]|nr:hypothetical protein [Prevotellaceae bacterium]